MCKNFNIFVLLILFEFGCSLGSNYVLYGHHASLRHKHSRKLRATNDGELRFEPAPYSKKLELNGSGKIHCKVAGGVSPKVQWFLNENDPLPDGMTSSNGTLIVTEASHRHAGQYTCRASDGDRSISANITLDIVVSPRVIEPASGEEIHVSAGQSVVLNCRAIGDPTPTVHWDRNATILNQQQKGIEVEGGANESNARIVLAKNGTLLIRSAKEEDTDHYGCTAGSAAGLARNELTLIVHPEGEPLPQESNGVAGKAVVVSVCVAGAYMILVLALMFYCRRRRLKRRERGEKLELEMAEGREKLVEDGETDSKKKVGNGAPLQNGRLLHVDKDSGADNSEVSAISRVSKKSGQYDHLTVPRTLLTEQITLGRGEFGDVLLAKIDENQVKKLRTKEEGDTEPKLRPVLVKVLTTKDESQLLEFRRQLEMFSRVRHENIARLIGLCNEAEPHYMLLEHTDWGDLKNFLIATRTAEENQEYENRVGASHALPSSGRTAAPLLPQHRAVLVANLAAGTHKLNCKRITHRDIAARNCVITPSLQLKLSYPALTRGPDSNHYYKLHDQVIPLRWLPQEAALEGDYSAKSDVYMFAATVWEIYTKAELPFAKLNDNSVLERLKAGSLEWSVPDSMPERLATLLKRCWSKSPSDRPQFDEICEEVSHIVKEITAENTSRHSQDNVDEA